MLSAGGTISKWSSQDGGKSLCLGHLVQQMVTMTGRKWDVKDLGLFEIHPVCPSPKYPVIKTDDSLIFWPFSIPRGRYIVSTVAIMMMMITLLPYTCT